MGHVHVYEHAHVHERIHTWSVTMGVKGWVADTLNCLRTHGPPLYLVTCLYLFYQMGMKR